MPQRAPWAGTLATGGMLVIAAFPFVVLFPEPPAFGRGTAALFAIFATLATVGHLSARAHSALATAWRAGLPGCSP